MGRRVAGGPSGCGWALERAAVAEHRLGKGAVVPAWRASRDVVGSRSGRRGGQPETSVDGRSGRRGDQSARWRRWGGVLRYPRFPGVCEHTQGFRATRALQPAVSGSERSRKAPPCRAGRNPTHTPRSRPSLSRWAGSQGVSRGLVGFRSRERGTPSIAFPSNEVRTRANVRPPRGRPRNPTTTSCSCSSRR
jgi:hypothetical protein